MALTSENLKTCGVKISADIGGVPSVGSGVVYVTPNYCDYDYVLTAKHIFQEDSQTPFSISQILKIEILYSDQEKLKRLALVRKEEVKSKLIVFDDDFIMIIIDKKSDIGFSQILVSDQLEDDDEKFYSWGIFSANQEEIHKFDFVRNDPVIKRFKSTGGLTESFLPGMSGAGIFAINKSVLLGIIN